MDKHLMALEDAKAIDPEITREDLEGLEEAIKAYTHNAFEDGFPFDVRLGAKKLLEKQKQRKEYKGVKSRSIGRVSETYDDFSSAVGSDDLDFLNPYRKFDWS